jgi:hypothetical protein
VGVNSGRLWLKICGSPLGILVVQNGLKLSLEIFIVFEFIKDGEVSIPL